jgi:hypothetical protein
VSNNPQGDRVLVNELIAGFVSTGWEYAILPLLSYTWLLS